MRLTRATLKAKQTEDGLCGVNDRVKLGTVYWVDLDTVRPMVWAHTDLPSTEERLSIFIDACENGTPAGWMPVELLNIPEMEAQAA